jgi:hypothetical protein
VDFANDNVHDGYDIDDAFRDARVGIPVVPTTETWTASFELPVFTTILFLARYYIMIIIMIIDHDGKTTTFWRTTVPYYR